MGHPLYNTSDDDDDNNSLGGFESKHYRSKQKLLPCKQLTQMSKQLTSVPLLLSSHNGLSESLLSVATSYSNSTSKSVSSEHNDFVSVSLVSLAMSVN